MHSHDRTLIARLGFDDPDKRNPRHDLACRYLAQPLIARALIEKVFQKSNRPEPEGHPFEGTRIRHEVPIMKGEGKYATIIGFTDVLYEFYRHYINDRDNTIYSIRESMIVEVKANPTAVSDILRQMNFYQSGLPAELPAHIHYVQNRVNYNVVVINFDISDSEREFLENSHIPVFRLGPQFDEWVKAQQGEPPDMSWDLTV